MQKEECQGKIAVKSATSGAHTMCAIIAARKYIQSVVKNTYRTAAKRLGVCGLASDIKCDYTALTLASIEGSFPNADNASTPYASRT
ncbi:MAG: hypothetical protein FWG73_00985 [Planctomycetaceae bacterium]|nr:hypothetical protein [Planctomycetaceae bacterium]